LSSSTKHFGYLTNNFIVINIVTLPSSSMRELKNHKLLLIPFFSLIGLVFIHKHQFNSVVLLNTSNEATTKL